MHSALARLVALVCLTVPLADCDPDRPLAPDADAALLTSSAASQKGPSNLSATASPGTISLAWQDNSPNET